MISSSSLVLPIIRSALHQQLQEFVQFDLRHIIRKFSKPKTKKKPAHEDVLKLLYVRSYLPLTLAREIAGDNLTADDPALAGKKDSSVPKISSRCASVSLAQLDSIRSVMWGLIHLRLESSYYWSYWIQG